ncbi:toprim domain-containing protein [Silvimonas terrae]|uniref:toprim domain-containing protein n=1 Tax=Silvimonas terrae TaxID=300266 RepID=UPI0027E3BDD8|nr:toprim domain-containing protein [Silvimonas terrae]
MSDARLLKRAHTVYLVESPINALSIEAAGLPAGTCAYALRGAGNVSSIDWSFLKGKRVVIALDHTDPVNAKTSQRPGLAGAWRLSELLTALGISNQLVDMQAWEEGEDINDVLHAHGPEELAKRLKLVEPWLIRALPPANSATRSALTRPKDGKRLWSSTETVASLEGSR